MYMKRLLGCTLAAGLVAFDVLGVRAWPVSQTTTMPSLERPPVVPEVGTGLLMGQVVDAAGGPVGGAVVSLGGGISMVGLSTIVQSATPAGQRRVLTGADGRFAFFNLPAGSYSLDASKPGYFPGAYGRLRSGGVAQSIDLADGERIGNLSIPMWKHAALSGTITDEAGEPAVGVQVWALRRVIESGRRRLNTSQASTAATDDRGVFRLASLAPGEYLLCVPSSVSSFPVEMADAFQVARQEGATLELSRQTSAAGVSAASVNPSGPGFRVGDRIVQVGGAMSRGAQVPGPAEDGRMAVYPTIFYPGTFAASQAEAFTLGSGDERTGVMLRLKLVPTATVAGTVVGPDGPVARVGVRLVSSYATDLTNELNFDPATTVTDVGGRFEFLGVPTGQYTIRVLKMPPALPRPPVARGAGPAPAITPYAPPVPEGPTLWANQPVSIAEAGISDLTVTLNRGVRVSGRFAFDGTSPRPTADLIQSIAITFIPADGHATGTSTPLTASIDPGGRITTYEIPPGRYLVGYAAFLDTRRALGTWLFGSATIGGRDVYSRPFDLQADVADLVITMTDHPAELIGTVRGAQGGIDAATAVLIVSVNRDGWSNHGTFPPLIRSLRPGKDGIYKLVNIVPGEYYIVAIPEADAGDWQDPSLLETLVRGATRFTIGAGEKKTQDVTTRPLR